MIRKLIIIDLLTFLPILLFVSIGQILIWIIVTFVIGLVIAAFSFGQIRTLMNSISDTTYTRVPALAVFIIPGFAGVLLMLPGLLTDLLAGLVLCASVATFITSITRKFTKRSQAEKTTDKRRQGNSRIIDVDYDTLDDNKP